MRFILAFSLFFILSCTNKDQPNELLNSSEAPENLIAEYLMERFDFEWNLEEQIKRTEEFEKTKALTAS